MKIYITRKIPEVAKEILEAQGHTCVINQADRPLTKQELQSELEKNTPDALLSVLTDIIDEEIFTHFPSIKIVANYAVGYNNINLESAQKRGVTVTNTPSALTETVAEHTLALMLALARRVGEGERLVRSGAWDGWGPMQLLGTGLHGKTLAIIGGGRIGYRVAEMCKAAFGMTILYYDIKQNDFFDKNLNARFFQNIDEILPLADIVSIHLPLLDSTKHLIDAEKLKLFKKNALLVNTARGGVIHEELLIEALQNKTIAGAALDVYENEPWVSSELRSLDNVILTPHTASATQETREDMARMAAQNIVDFFAGKTPANVVQK